MYILQKNKSILFLIFVYSLVCTACTNTSEKTLSSNNDSTFYIHPSTTWIASFDIQKLKKEVIIDLLLGGEFKKLFQSTDQKTFLKECIFDAKTKGLSETFPLYLTTHPVDSSPVIALHFMIEDSALVHNYIAKTGRREKEGFFTYYQNQLLFIFNRPNDSLIAHQYFQQALSLPHFEAINDNMAIAYNRKDSTIIELAFSKNSVLCTASYHTNNKENNQYFFQPAQNKGIFMQGQMSFAHLKQLAQMAPHPTLQKSMVFLNKTNPSTTTSFAFQYLGMKKNTRTIIKTIVNEEFETKNITTKETYFEPDVNLSIARNDFSNQMVKQFNQSGILAKEGNKYLIVPGNFTLYLNDDQKNDYTIGTPLSYTKDTAAKALFYFSYIPNTFQHIKKEDQLHARIKTVDSICSKHIEKLLLTEQVIAPQQHRFTLEIQTHPSEHSLFHIGKIINGLVPLFNARNPSND